MTKGVLFHQDNAPAHKSVVASLQWLFCVTVRLVTVALNWLISDDHPPYSPDLAPSDYFLFPNRELGNSIGPMMRSYLQLRTFSRIRMRASITRESKRCNTDGRSMYSLNKKE